MSLRDYVENKEHYQELFELERKKDATIKLLKGFRCDTCVYMILKNKGHYCGSFVEEPWPAKTNNCVAYEPRNSA